MAVAEQDQMETGTGGGNARNTALKAAAAAAATSAATIAVKKMMSHESGSNGRRDSSAEKNDDGERNVSTLLSSVGSSAWEAASGVLIPMAEDAADAAGKYLAEHGPEVVRDRIVPRFIEAFNDAK